MTPTNIDHEQMEQDSAHAAHDKHGAHDGQGAHDEQGAHDKHAGHSVEMFRDKFWWSVALTVPTVVWSPMVQQWLGFHAPTFPGSRSASACQPWRARWTRSP